MNQSVHAALSLFLFSAALLISGCNETGTGSTSNQTAGIPTLSTAQPNITVLPSGGGSVGIGNGADLGAGDSVPTALLKFMDGPTIDYGSVTRFSTQTRVLTIKNTSTSVPATNISLESLPSGFTIAGGTYPGTYHITNGTCWTSLAAGESCTIIVGFTPTSGGSVYKQPINMDYYNGSSQATATAQLKGAGTLSGSIATEVFNYAGAAPGIVTVAVPSFSIPYATVVQSDGEFLVAGSNGLIMRYTGDGSPDVPGFTGIHAVGNGGSLTGFGTNGNGQVSLGTGDTLYGMALQNDGKIVVTGNTYTGSNYTYVLARLNPDGSLDGSFNGTGMVRLSTGSSILGTALKIQSDGRILVAGSNSNQNGSSFNNNFMMVRYLTDGTVDTSFSCPGTLASGQFGLGTPTSIAIEANGNIVLTGGNTTGRLMGVRYLSDGTLDTSAIFPGNFGGSYVRQQSLVSTAAGLIGVLSFGLFQVSDTPFGTVNHTIAMGIGTSTAIANAMIVQSDGKIVVGGQATNIMGNHFALARFSGAATAFANDTTFALGSTITTIGTQSMITGLGILYDGAVLATGYSRDAAGHFYWTFVRYYQ